MNMKQLLQSSSGLGSSLVLFSPEELPLSVRDATAYLGVRVQTQYPLAERRQILSAKRHWQFSDRSGGLNAMKRVMLQRAKDREPGRWRARRIVATVVWFGSCY